MVQKQAMAEAVSSADTPEQNTGGGIIEEGHRLPGKGVSAREPEAQDVVLHSTLQPHFLTTAI